MRIHQDPIRDLGFPIYELPALVWILLNKEAADAWQSSPSSS